MKITTPADFVMQVLSTRWCLDNQIVPILCEIGEGTENCVFIGISHKSHEALFRGFIEERLRKITGLDVRVHFQVMNTSAIGSKLAQIRNHEDWVKDVENGKVDLADIPYGPDGNPGVASDQLPVQQTQAIRTNADEDTRLGCLLVVIVLIIVGAVLNFCSSIIKETEVPENIKRITACEILVKEGLKDPSSYRQVGFDADNGTLTFSATNSFGGRLQKTVKCF